MKIKLSFVLLIALGLFLIGSMFASNFILKKEYNRVSKNKDFQYTLLSNQPFKHLKLVQGNHDDNFDTPSNYGQISFEVSDAYSAYSLPTSWFEDGKDTITSKIVDDTLVISLSRYTQSLYDRDAVFNLRIKAPKIESITCVNSSIMIFNFMDDHMRISLFGNSSFSFPKNIKSLKSIKANLWNESELRLDSILNINILDITLKDKSTLRMPRSEEHTSELQSQ